MGNRSDAGEVETLEVDNEAGNVEVVVPDETYRIETAAEVGTVITARS